MKPSVQVLHTIDYFDESESLLELKHALLDGNLLGILKQDVVEDTYNFVVELIETIKTAELNVDVEAGFAWLSTDDEDNIFQFCIDKDSVFDPFDLGAGWGICGDYNHDFWGSYTLIELIEKEVINTRFVDYEKELENSPE